MNDDASMSAALIAAGTSTREPDAHGQAALLLAECILHALVETKTLSVEGALSVIRTTCDVKAEVAVLSGESEGRMRESLSLLQAILTSFSADSDHEGV